MSETLAQLQARETKILAALDKVRDSQEWRDGRMSVARGPYATLLVELADVQKKIAVVNGQGTGGAWNRAKFTRVL